MEVKRLSPQAYELHKFLLSRCEGKENSMLAKDVCFWMGLKDTRTLRKLREEINSNKSEIQRKVLTSNKGYYIATAFTSEEAKQQYIKVAWRKIHSGIAQIREGQQLLKQAGLDGQTKLNLGGYEKEIVEIATRLGVEND